MASVAGLNGTANLAAYVAGKAGIIGLTKVAALDYADQGIRVNVVAPGPILTHHLAAAGPEAQRQAGLATPMPRTGTAAEVAQVVLWLCSEQFSFVTGAVVPVDGGQSAATSRRRCTGRGRRCPDGRRVVDNPVEGAAQSRCTAVGWRTDAV
jgi:NAD(P)-dependent dehydrogenase (short-subunit alcohol dehydrogenase family)